jgi:protein ImuB
VPPPVYRAQASFIEPIFTEDNVIEAATRLLKNLVKDLARKASGIRLLQLLLFRVDGHVLSLNLGLAAPSRDARHIAQLIGLRLYRLGNFGFESVAVHVLVAEPVVERQPLLGMGESTPPDALPRLIDKLQQRLGTGAVRQLIPEQSHIPERAMRNASPSPLMGQDGADGGPAKRRNSSATRIKSGASSDPSPHGREGSAAHPRRRKKASSASNGEKAEWAEMPLAPRPLLMLPKPEAIEVVALIPEGPPRQFRWRGILHQVTATQGPERITPEWWRRTDEAERDYYLAEDRDGRRFWLYRAGLYSRGNATPQWFMHGVFA